jgi:hypothetical protein
MSTGHPRVAVGRADQTACRIRQSGSGCPAWTHSVSWRADRELWRDPFAGVGKYQVFEQRIARVCREADQPDPHALRFAHIHAAIYRAAGCRPQRCDLAPGVNLGRRRRVDNRGRIDARCRGVAGAQADCRLLGDDQPFTGAAKWRGPTKCRHRGPQPGSLVTNGAESGQGPPLRAGVRHPERHISPFPHMVEFRGIHVAIDAKRWDTPVLGATPFAAVGAGRDQIHATTRTPRRSHRTNVPLAG